MMSILSLALMCVLLATMRYAPGMRSGRPSQSAKRPDNASWNSASRPSRTPSPGVVSYKLMDEKKLPSPMTRAWRRLSRPFGWLGRRFGAPKVDIKADRTSMGQSVELQNFLDARNREIARRKSENNKRGPGDTLH